VRTYSHEVSASIKNAIQQSAAITQLLDQSFPNRLLTRGKGSFTSLGEPQLRARLLIEEGSRDKIKAHKDAGRTVIEIIVAACVPLGCLRLYSHTSGASLRFEGLRYRYLGRKLEEITVDAVVKEVFDHTQRHAGLEDAATFIKTFDTSAIDIRELVCGHDLSAALGIALQSLIGSRPAAYCVASELEAKLRMGFSREDFAQTSIHAEILDWQQRNPPFRCLH
jgi:hypothetical protein